MQSVGFFKSIIGRGEAYQENLVYFEKLGGKEVGTMVEAGGREMHWVEI